MMLNYLPLFTLSACRVVWKLFLTALYQVVSVFYCWLAYQRRYENLVIVSHFAEWVTPLCGIFLIQFGHLHHVDDHLFTHCGQWWRQPLMKIQQVTQLLPKFILLANSWSSTPAGERRMRGANKISIALFFKSNMHMYECGKSLQKWMRSRVCC